jgi:glutamyl-tRNA synthetase
MPLNDVVRKHAIQNRLQYGKADERAVLGKVLSEVLDAKEDIKGLMRVIKSIVYEINNLDGKVLEKYELSRERAEKTIGLKLPGNPRGVIMRFAPNPNGPATLGSARGIVVNSELAGKYDGKFILRFDDTDPKNKKPLLKAYEWYLQDCEWLGAKPDEVYYASDRISLYYEYAERLISLGKAYVCFCSQEGFKKLRDGKMECPHRGQSSEENQGLWERMLSGRYEDGECVLRIKTDIKHKDPALRDWVAFRIVRENHPRVGKKFIVWPMLDFESAIEDHLLEVTHIIRGKDLIDSEHRQRFIYNYLGWEYPATMHWGRISVAEFGRFSTSKLRELIENGEYAGWDDPRLPTLLALRRRGISPEAVIKLMVGLGINETDVSISMENIFSENRKIMDPRANRYFFVEEPVELLVGNAPEKTVGIPLHPSFPERGQREFELNAGCSGDLRLFISARDNEELRPGQEIRLMNLFNVEVSSVGKELKAIYLDKKNLDVYKIHWLHDHLNAEVIMPDRTAKGFCETSCRDLDVGEVIQFERFGFVRLDRMEDEGLSFYFGHR